MNNFVIILMFFLSGAVYRIDQAPGWLKAIIRINPVDYGALRVPGHADRLRPLRRCGLRGGKGDMTAAARL